MPTPIESGISALGIEEMAAINISNIANRNKSNRPVHLRINFMIDSSNFFIKISSSEMKPVEEYAVTWLHVLRIVL